MSSSAFGITKQPSIRRFGAVLRLLQANVNFVDRMDGVSNEVEMLQVKVVGM